ncbi:MAG: class A beta-lactamase-related serine hydrolase [Planctomycetota bacterium]|nr:MAG: class A beta-lactamase-related serine hydrolase [Planctomycetota bacterium]
MRGSLSPMLAALCAALVLQQPLAPPLGAPRADDAAERRALAALVEHAVDPNPARPFWGAVLVVWRGAPLFSRGYGYANLAGLPVDERTLFDVGSVSKQFTAAAVLRLARDGKLRLTDTLAAHFADVPSPQCAITIDQLLHHRSGYRQTTATDAKDGAFDESPRAWERHLLSRPLAAAPGESFLYCNYNYLLLARIVERVSGKPFEQFVRASVLEPARMSSARFVGDCDGDTSHLAVRRHRYRRPGPPPPACDWAWGPGYQGATGVLCSLADLEAWHAALSSDAVLDSGERDAFFSASDERYACGWYVITEPSGRRWHTHDGRTDGFRASLSRCGDEDALVAVLTNESTFATLVDTRIRQVLPLSAAGEVR